MRRIVANFFTTVDGVVEAPNTWHFPYHDDAVGEIIGAGLASATGVVMGRRLYDEWSQYWPANPGDPFGDFVNPVAKYVLTHRPLGDEPWHNSTAVGGADEEQTVAAIQAIKQDGEGELLMSGSAGAARWLLAHGLLDELALLVDPIVVGEGARLFDGPSRVPLTLLSATPLPSGALHLRYAPAD